MSEAATTEPVTRTAYERIGGADVVRQIADAFYDAMDREPKFAALRAMHSGDLTPMRESLAGFLTVWLGGPRDWVESHQGFCLMSRHRPMPITAATSAQWMDAMVQALTETGVDAELATKIEQALRPAAEAMVPRERK
jgi:hemoglobin